MDSPGRHEPPGAVPFRSDQPACACRNPAGASNGETPLARQAQRRVARIPSSQPGRCGIPSGFRPHALSAANVSASINSSCALARRFVIGALAGVLPPRMEGTSAPANHSHVTATPVIYQSLEVASASSSHRRSARAHTAAKSDTGTRRLPRGTSSMWRAVTSTLPGSHRPRTTGRVAAGVGCLWIAASPCPMSGRLWP
jgi:hypothetical protein